jgi:hypothetical protein
MWSVTAIADHAVVRGYTATRPMVPQPAHTGEIEIEEPAAVGRESRLRGACLYDQPLGRFAGFVTGPVDAEIAPARLGWVQVVVHGPAGDAVRYARAPLAEPEPKQSDVVFEF